MNHSPKISAGIIPVKKTADGYLFLILRAYNYWDFPKGALKPAEVPLAGALREFTEETCLTKVEYLWGEVYLETEAYSRGKVARYYIAQVDPTEEVKLIPNPETGIIEHHEFCWVSYQEARDKFVPRLKKIIDWAMAVITKV